MKISIWLVPTSQYFDKLQDEISLFVDHFSKANQQELPTFIPHITLIGGIPCADREQAMRLARSFENKVRKFGKVPCSFKEELTQFANDDGAVTWNTSCVAPMEPSDKFDTLVELTAATIEEEKIVLSKSRHRPHFSLTYGHDIDKTLFPKTFLSTDVFECDSVVIYCTSPSNIDGVRNNWHRIGDPISLI